MRKALIALLVLLALAAAAAGGAGVWLERAFSTPARPGDTTEVVFTVPRGMSAKAIGARLESEGLIADARLWRAFLWRHRGLKVMAGRYALGPGLTLNEVARVLQGPPLPEDEPLTLIEGWRLRDTDAALAARGWATPGAYIAAASKPSRFRAPFPLPQSSLEGYLFPETYGVVREGFDVNALIQRQLDTFTARFVVPHQEEILASKRSLHEIVIMASLLEREEPLPENRPLVAGILWKRLDNDFALGVDATSRYELEEWNDRRAFLVELRDANSRWNTRLRKGLPPGPIGAPSLSSLVAALRPVESEYWYYLHDSKGRLHPSRNSAEHEALRRKYNVW